MLLDKFLQVTTQMNLCVCVLVCVCLCGTIILIVLQLHHYTMNEVEN